VKVRELRGIETKLQPGWIKGSMQEETLEFGEKREPNVVIFILAILSTYLCSSQVSKHFINKAQ
jgi:hypothetical protein